MNQYFSALTRWDRSAIETRSQALAQLVLGIYPYLGDDHIQPISTGNTKGSKPRSLWILGQRFDVATWRDVLETTWNEVAELEPEKFDHLAHVYDRFLSRDTSRFRSSRQLKNGFYFEVNLSSKDIYRLCTQSVAEIGLSSEDWRVEY
jgi:hypothetical protein